MVQYILGECMVSIINIDNGIKTHGYQTCDMSHMFIFGGYLRATNLCISKLLLNRINNIFNHIHIRGILLHNIIKQYAFVRVDPKNITM